MNTVRKIVIVEYRPEWPDEFAAVARPIHEALGDMALRIDHIGSTSVPGLAAKDVIDLQITVRDLTPEMEATLEGAGYTGYGFTKDHRPPTATGPDRDWEKRFFRPGTDSRPANIHVRRA